MNTSENDSLTREVLPALQLGAGTLLLMEAMTALLTSSLLATLNTPNTFSIRGSHTPPVSQTDAKESEMNQQ